jgi:hypothetical protein
MRSAPAGVTVDGVEATLSTAVAVGGLALLKGALVALPRPAALGRLERLRSPAWACVLPGMLLVGTFGVLALPGMATGLAVLAAVATPALACIAVVAVVHGRRRWLLLVPPALVFGTALTGWAGQLAASLVTALGCLTLGAGLVRLTPAPWLALGVAGMCAVDVLLLTAGIGQPAAALLGDAMRGIELPALHHAQIGPIQTDYPDLILAAVVGAVLAGRVVRWRAAALVATLAGAYTGLLTVVTTVPDTVPLALALLVLHARPQASVTGGAPLLTGA